MFDFIIAILYTTSNSNYEFKGDIIMKKLFAILFAGILLLSCSNNSSNSSSNGAKMPKIGILQLVEHNALDQANKGFVDGLKEAGYEDGKNITIDYQNAQGEQANCITISQKFVNDKVDLILAIATPAAQAAANTTKDIQIGRASCRERV